MLSRRALLLSTVTAPVIPATSPMKRDASPKTCVAPDSNTRAWKILKSVYEIRALRANAASAFYEALSIGDLAEAKSAIQILRDIENSEGPDVSPEIDVDDMGAEANLARLLFSCFEI
jgi:hypothetical protein